jgi:glycosyltransferase involved in cell wall biosynthesis
LARRQRAEGLSQRRGVAGREAASQSRLTSSGLRRPGTPNQGLLETNAMHIAFLSTRAAKPSFRFRVERMLPFFANAGHRCETMFLASNVWRRLALYRKLSRYDAVFLQKRLLSRPELMFLRRNARTLVYDIDDAIMYHGTGAEDRRGQSRFAAMMRAADLVVCGNQYLADDALRLTNRVTIVPTCIDINAYHPRLRHNDPNHITIGWTGSRSTNPYLNEILPLLPKIHAPIAVKVISETMAEIDFSVLGNLPRTFVPWSPATEIVETATFDIGVMPVPENRFTQGKCGFKALQYMALGIPAVCSPVGANRDIIHDEVDGFLPRGRDDWFQTIVRLAKDPFLRETIGHAGRRRVEQAFSLAFHGPRLVQAIEQAQRALRKSA